jgi:hypothetical protein
MAAINHQDYSSIPAFGGISNKICGGKKLGFVPAFFLDQLWKGTYINLLGKKWQSKIGRKNEKNVSAV